jgi:hypothetical protein
MDGQAWTCVGWAASRLSSGDLDARGRRYEEEGEISFGGALRRVPLGSQHPGRRMSEKGEDEEKFSKKPKNYNLSHICVPIHFTYATSALHMVFSCQIRCRVVFRTGLVFFAKTSAKCGSVLLPKHKVVPKSKFSWKCDGSMLTTPLSENRELTRSTLIATERPRDLGNGDEL